MWLLTGKTLYFFTVLLSGSGSDPLGVRLFFRKIHSPMGIPVKIILAAILSLPLL